MKFTFATAFTLALAMGVQSSVIPWAHSHLAEVAGHGLSYTAVSTPVHAHLLAHAPAAIALHESPVWRGDLHGAWNGGLNAAIIADAHSLHVPLAHAHIHAHEGQYLAKTRGAVHAAPLAGHIASAAAINIAPAPGTI